MGWYELLINPTFLTPSMSHDLQLCISCIFLNLLCLLVGGESCSNLDSVLLCEHLGLKNVVLLGSHDYVFAPRSPHHQFVVAVANHYKVEYAGNAYAKNGDLLIFSTRQCECLALSMRIKICY